MSDPSPEQFAKLKSLSIAAFIKQVRGVQTPAGLQVLLGTAKYFALLNRVKEMESSK